MDAEPTPLAELVRTRRVLITAGAGGVGKTTTAAALSVAAALAGRRVLCLTIDPARRLAESLGLEKMSTEAVAVDAQRFEARGLRLEGSLTAMMLDTKRTFDELVVKYSSTHEKAEQLLQNKLYQYVSTQLAGTQEYMAMEKLVAVKDDPAYDLIVLDTPPTANALDFLDAPERLVAALDSTAMKWLVEAFQSTGKVSMNLLAKGAAGVLKGVAKITGGGFVEIVAEFVSQLNDLFGGFRERASRVQAALRSDEVAFVLVSSPAPESLKEAIYFAERLIEHRMPCGALVVNRVHTAPERADVDRGVAASALSHARVMLDDDGPDRLLAAHADRVRLADLDRRHVAELSRRATASLPLVKVAELETDVHDLVLLARLSTVLMAGGNA